MERMDRLSSSRSWQRRENNAERRGSEIGWHVWGRHVMRKQRRRRLRPFSAGWAADRIERGPCLICDTVPERGKVTLTQQVVLPPEVLKGQQSQRNSKKTLVPTVLRSS